MKERYSNWYNKRIKKINNFHKGMANIPTYIGKINSFTIKMRDYNENCLKVIRNIRPSIKSMNCLW